MCARKLILAATLDKCGSTLACRRSSTCVVVQVVRPADQEEEEDGVWACCCCILETLFGGLITRFNVNRELLVSRPDPGRTDRPSGVCRTESRNSPFAT